MVIIIILKILVPVVCVCVCVRVRVHACTCACMHVCFVFSVLSVHTILIDYLMLTQLPYITFRGVAF